MSFDRPNSFAMESEPPFKQWCSRESSDDEPYPYETIYRHLPESSDDEPYGLTCVSSLPYETIYLPVQPFTKAWIWFFLRHVHSGWLLGFRHIIKLFFLFCDAKNGTHNPNAIFLIDHSAWGNAYNRNINHVILKHVYLD